MRSSISIACVCALAGCSVSSGFDWPATTTASDESSDDGTASEGVGGSEGSGGGADDGEDAAGTTGSGAGDDGSSGDAADDSGSEGDAEGSTGAQDSGAATSGGDPLPPFDYGPCDADCPANACTVIEGFDGSFCTTACVDGECPAPSEGDAVALCSLGPDLAMPPVNCVLTCAVSEQNCPGTMACVDAMMGADAGICLWQ